MDKNKQWMNSGKIGCTFAVYFSKFPELCNWYTVEESNFHIPKEAALLSIQFPDKNITYVRNWALSNGFYEELVGEGLIGLRYNIDDKISWVQYFGPDSHVITRQAPIPELMLCVKLDGQQYYKVVQKNILHLASASVKYLSNKISDTFWNSSFKKTKKLLGHTPTVVEAARTTFKL